MTKMYSEREIMDTADGVSGKGWARFKSRLGRRLYFRKVLKDNGCWRFRDWFKFMFTRKLSTLQFETIDRLRTLYEGIWASFQCAKRSSSSDFCMVRRVETPDAFDDLESEDLETVEEQAPTE